MSRTTGSTTTLTYQMAHDRPVSQYTVHMPVSSVSVGGDLHSAVRAAAAPVATGPAHFLGGTPSPHIGSGTADAFTTTTAGPVTPWYPKGIEGVMLHQPHQVSTTPPHHQWQPGTSPSYFESLPSPSDAVPSPPLHRRPAAHEMVGGSVPTHSHAAAAFPVTPASSPVAPIHGEANLGRALPSSWRSRQVTGAPLDHTADAAADASTGKSRPPGGLFGFDPSMRAGAFNLCNVVLGSGIIGLPATIGQAGVGLGFALMALLAALTDYSLRLLVTAGLQLRAGDYEDLLRAAFGRRGWLLALWAILALDFGFMVAALLVVADTLPSVLSFYDEAMSAAAVEDSFAPPSIFRDRTLTLCIVAFGVVLPLSLGRSLRKLGVVSMASVASVVGIVAIVCWRFFTGTASDAAMRPNTHLTPPTDGSGGASDSWTLVGANPFGAIGSLAFVFVCHDASFAVYSSLATPTPQTWSRVVRAAVGTALVPMTLLAFAGYFAFSSSGASGGGGAANLRANILDHFARDDHAVNVARLALASSLAMTYPLNLFMCRHALARLIGLVRPAHGGGGASSTPLARGPHVALTLVLFLSSLVLAANLHDLSRVQSLVGGVAGSLLAFALPAVCAIRARQMVEARPVLHRSNLAALGLLAVAILAMTTAAYQALFTDEDDTHI